MIHGLDTGVLVAAEIAEHPRHQAARNLIERLTQAGDQFGIAPQVMTEFLHVVTDARRLVQPLSMVEALSLSKRWWLAAEVVQVFPADAAMHQCFDWIRKHSLGRKRLLDTLLASTFLQAGVTSILTTNPADFAVFGVFNCITPTS